MEEGELQESTLVYLIKNRRHAEAIEVIEQNKNGEIINARNEVGDTPLHYAAEYGYSDVVIKLIDAGADINAKDQFGYTPLHTIGAIGIHTDILEILIRSGADMLAMTDDLDIPLYKYTMYNNTACFDKILQSHVLFDINLQNKYGRTLLHGAFLNFKMTKTLIRKYGIDVNIKNIYKNTALDELKARIMYTMERSHPLINDANRIISCITHAINRQMYIAIATLMEKYNTFLDRYTINQIKEPTVHLKTSL